MTRGTSGPTSHGSSERLEQIGLFSRTSPAICHSDSTRSAASFKEWASSLRRVYSARRKSAQAIVVNGSSSWPTATEDNANNCAGPSRRRGAEQNGYQDLTVAAREWTNITAQANDLWMTPTSRDHKDASDPSEVVPTRSLLGRQAPRWTGQESQSDSGPRRLNPEFVEWLMGWPVGWTDFAPVATEWYRWRRRMLSELSRLHWQDA